MEDPKEECERLMNAMVPFAERMLSTHREVYPFGGGLAPDGRIIAVGGDTGRERPTAQEVIAFLERGLQDGARAGRYKATALVVDMQVVPPDKDGKQDAIAVRLDHRAGYSVVVMFPYRIEKSGAVTVEPPFAIKGEQRIFPR